MRGFLGRVGSFVRRDARHLRANVVALVALVGMVAVPSFYAWFNIAGSWDPYGNTDNIRVAVASEDEGYTGELVPVSVNLADRVIDELRASDTIDYVVTSADDAVGGVCSGEYYAAIVLPEDFSRDLMTMLSSDPERPQVRFYQNEKANAIAAIVTGKAEDAVLADINRGFASAVTTVGAGTLEELGHTLDDEGVQSLAGRLAAAVSDASDQIRGSAEDARDLSGLLSDTEELLTTGGDAASAALSPTAGAGETLRETAEGLEGAGTALDDASDAVAGALTSAGTSLDDVRDAIDGAFATAATQQGSVQDALADADASLKDQMATLDELTSSLDQADDLLARLQASLGEGGAGAERVAAVRSLVAGLAETAREVRAELQDLADGIEQTAADLASGAKNAEDARSELDGLLADARDALDGAQASYDDTARDTLADLADQVGTAADGADEVQGGLAGALSSVEGAASGAAGALEAGRDALDDVAGQLDAAADGLGELRARLGAALDSADTGQLRAVLSSGTGALAEFMASPVSVERTAVYPVENNGSAMAPFYTTLAIWIGGVVLAALVRATPSEDALAETGCSHAGAYLGRLALFCAVGVAQAALIAGGDLAFLGVQCAHPALFVLACVASSVVYVNLIFSLTASFGDVGKAVAVVLMVIQVAGSGGTFPPQMLPPVFQALYQWLPFVHSEGALRAAMFGLYGLDYWRELAVLLAYLAPALVLGLVVRRPVIRLGAWFERRLEDTRLM